MTFLEASCLGNEAGDFRAGEMASGAGFGSLTALEMECLDTIERTAAADIARVIQGKRVKFPVNRPVKRR